MEKEYAIHNLWMILCTMMVFILHLGFATLEAGFTQRKNSINILFKNTIIPVIGILSFSYIGFNLMYPGEEHEGGFWGVRDIDAYTGGLETTHAYDRYFTFYAFIVFKAMFAATAATIVSGAVAERIKFISFIIFSVIFVSFCYPIIGMWVWGGGFLATLEVPFYDFSGASVVHSVGGWGALAGAILLGPRIGKYRNGKIHRIKGHNLALVTIGIFLLWFGWFGFNGGSVFSADPVSISLVILNTSICASAGAMGAWITTWLIAKKHDLGIFITGILGALVSSTAAADLITPNEAGIIGMMAGVLVILTTYGLDKIKIDDPVRAVPAHLVCGIWGTLTVALFGKLAGINQLLTQLTGILIIGFFSFGSSLLIFFVIKKTIGLRVSRKVELEGLDPDEHGLEAYNENFSYNEDEEEKEVLR
jgi:ammonium transporter, Amt family